MLRLKSVMDSKGISTKEYAALLGMAERTLYNKLSGSSEFTISEFQKLKVILPEYNVEYLLTEVPTGR